jgi:hypothetical protein
MGGMTKAGAWRTKELGKASQRNPVVSQEERQMVVTVFEKVFCYEPT